jgi:hypothetical protein
MGGDVPLKQHVDDDRHRVGRAPALALKQLPRLVGEVELHGLFVRHIFISVVNHAGPVVGSRLCP